jgi:STE24 endopeptidase
LQATEDPDAFVAMQRQLALRSYSDPTPPAWSQLWFGSHPTSVQRIAIARQLSPTNDEAAGPKTGGPASP